MAVFAGATSPEKRVTLLPDAIAAAREKSCRTCAASPSVTARDADALVLRVSRSWGLPEAFEVPGRVPPEQVERAIREAACLVLPSQREGYGMVVVEAVARGVPAVVVAGPDNAATELVEPGVNGFIAASADPREIARCVVAAVEGGDELRRSTLELVPRTRPELSIEGSLWAPCVGAYGDIARS